MEYKIKEPMICLICKNILEKDTIIKFHKQLSKNRIVIQENHCFHKIKYSTFRRCCEEL